jgi:hypothetical protein
MAQTNTKGAAAPKATAPDNAGDGIEEIAGHITETFVALVMTAIWFVAILGVTVELSFIVHWTQEHSTWMLAS